MKSPFLFIIIAIGAGLWYFWPKIQAARDSTSTALADAEKKAADLETANKKLQADLDKLSADAKKSK